MQYRFGKEYKILWGAQPPETVRKRRFPEIATSALGPPRNDCAGTAVQRIRPVIARATESEASARGNPFFWQLVLIGTACTGCGLPRRSLCSLLAMTNQRKDRRAATSGRPYRHHRWRGTWERRTGVSERIISVPYGHH